MEQDHPKPLSLFKIGSGLDVHALVRGRDLILGGVKIPHEKGLAGHSDADALIHSVCDALLGALGLGDIGDHFPDTDPRYKGIASSILLERCDALLRESGYEIVNMDCLVFAQAPRLGPYKQKMACSLARILHLDPCVVNVKATTTEHLGFVGKRQGIAAQTTLLIQRITGK